MLFWGIPLTDVKYADQPYLNSYLLSSKQEKPFYPLS